MRAEEDKDQIPELSRLKVESPPNSMLRFRRRAAIAQGTKMLFESQVMGFWTVLDAFLRLFLGSNKREVVKQELRSKQGDKA